MAKKLNKEVTGAVDQFTFAFRDKSVTFSASKLCAFDTGADAAKKFAADYAMLLALEQFLYRRSVELKAELTVKRAVIDRTIRAGWDESTDGKRTEDGVRSKVDLNESVASLTSELREAEFDHRVVQGLFTAASIKYAALTGVIYKQ